MSRTGATPENRPLFDPQMPCGVVFYPTYRIIEVARITGIGPDKIRSLFRDGYYGKVIPVSSQRIKPHKTRNHVMLLIPYQTLMNFLRGEKGAVA